MRFFLDTEFWERPEHGVEPISVALVSDSGAELYVVNGDFDWNRSELWEDPSGAWLLDNVAPSLELAPSLVVPRAEIGALIRKFVLRESGGGAPRFYGYYSAYDWVVLCQLFGRMVDLPDEFPGWCVDLRQVREELGNPELPPKPKEHCSIIDARWIRSVWLSLMEGCRAEGGV